LARLPVLTAQDAETLLLDAGFEWLRSKGSHRIYKKGDIRVTVPFHSSRTLHPKIVKQILVAIKNVVVDRDPCRYHERETMGTLTTPEPAWVGGRASWLESVREGMRLRQGGGCVMRGNERKGGSGRLWLWWPLGLALAGASPAGAQLVPVPVGAELQVNSYTPGYQTNPAVSHGPEGDFVVVWQSYYQDGSRWGVFAQRFALATVTPTPTPTTPDTNTPTATPTETPVQETVAAPRSVWLALLVLLAVTALAVLPRRQS
jgi:predicted RNA binding protein YcfA (HicA-like mRNA interferase family)